MRIVGMVTVPKVKEVHEPIQEPTKDKVDYSTLDREEIKQLLNEKGIEFSSNTPTKHLIKLLEGAQ